MSIKAQVDPNSFEWSHVDYTLQLAVGKSSLRIINMFKFQPNDPFGDYRYRCQALINITDFSKDYCNRVINKTIPLQDLFFYCGHLNIHEYANQPSKVFTVYLCKINLGKIGYPNQDVAACDSVYIQPEDDSLFQYNYFVRKHQQYEVMYQISFTVGDEKDFKLTDYQCSNCENKVPTTYCKTEKLYFCDDCSREHHKTKLMQTHQLERLDKVNTLPLCKNHNLRFEFYCLKCQKYLCSNCVQKGVHHQNHQHPFKPVQYLYEEKKQVLQVLPKRHREKIQSLLMNLKVKKDDVIANYNDVRKFVVSQYEKILTALQDLMRQKITMLNSYELQLKMTNDRLQWSKAFIKFQQKNLKPIYYFQSEQKFEVELNKLKISDFEGIFTTKADIAAEGQIIVARKDMIDRSRRKTTNLYVSPEKQITNSNLFTTRKNDKSLIQFDPNCQPPKKGQLLQLLENSNLNFFQIASK